MSEESKSTELTCPRCDRLLVGQAGKAEFESDDMLSCPVHGQMGRFEDIANDKAFRRQR
jgi:hypothetical protein